MDKELIKKLTIIYNTALKAENYTCALKALELQGKLLGLFADNKTPHLKALQDMSLDQLRLLIGTEAEKQSL